jgi:hypothetical protein
LALSSLNWPPSPLGWPASLFTRPSCRVWSHPFWPASIASFAPLSQADTPSSWSLHC